MIPTSGSRIAIRPTNPSPRSIAAYLLLLSTGILLVIRVVGGLAPTGVPRALPLLMLEITLSLTVAVAGGARFSTVTNAITAVGFYGVAFIGGFVEQIGAFGGITSMRTIGVLVSLLSPADSMWRLAAHYMEPEILRSTGALALGAVGADGLVGGGVHRTDAALRHPRVPSAGVVATYPERTQPRRLELSA